MSQPPQPPIQLVNPMTGAITPNGGTIQQIGQPAPGAVHNPAQFMPQRFMPTFTPGQQQPQGVTAAQPSFPVHNSMMMSSPGVMSTPGNPTLMQGGLSLVKPAILSGSPMPVPVQIPGQSTMTFNPSPNTPSTPMSWNVGTATPGTSPATPKGQFIVANTPTKVVQSPCTVISNNIQFSPMQSMPSTPGTPHTPVASAQPITPGSGQGSNTGGSNIATAANIQVLAAQIPAVLTGIDMRRRDWPSRRTPRDKDEVVQEELRSFAEDSKLFGRLLAFEKLVDASLKKRHTHISEALPRENNQTVTVTRFLRLCIYNTFENQGGVYQNEAPGVVQEQPSWSLRIEGRLREDQPPPTNPKVKMPADKKFSSFFKKIFVQLDKDLYPDNWLIEWNKDTAATADTEGFEIKRIGSQEFTVNVLLHLDHNPARFKLSQQLAQLLQLNESYTKTHIILSLWHYIRKAKLQDAEQRSVVHLDEPLRQIFGVTKFDYVDIPGLLQQHLGPPDPIQLSYTLRLDGNPENHEQWYQIPVEVENTAAYLKTNPTIKKDIETLNQQIQENILKIKEKKRKREFFSEFSDDPVGFMNDFLASQIRDHKFARTIGRDIEEERHSSYYRNPLIKEAINQYLEKLPMKMEFEMPAGEVDNHNDNSASEK